jgi:hypothetical protein
MTQANVTNEAVQTALRGVQEYTSAARPILADDAQTLEAAHQRLTQAIRVLEDNIRALNDLIARKKAELQWEKAAWARCQQDESANCFGYAAAVRQLEYELGGLVRQLRVQEDMLRQARILERQLSDALASFRRQAARMNTLIEREVAEAAGFLQGRIAALTDYETSQMAASVGTSAENGFRYVGKPHQIPPDAWFRPHLFSYDVRGSLFGAELHGHKPTLNDPRVGAALGFHLLKAQATVLRGGVALSGDAFIGAKVGLDAGVKVEKSTALLNLSFQTFLGGQFTPQTVFVAGRAISVDGMVGAKWGPGGSLDIQIGIDNGIPTLKFGKR